jgi:hypothetical protein
MEEGARGQRSIDDIWRELNARAAPPPRPVVRNAASTGIPGLGLPGVTTRTRILPSKAGGGGGGGGGAAAAPVPAPPPAPLLPEAAGVSAADLQSYVAGLQVGGPVGRATHGPAPPARGGGLLLAMPALCPDPWRLGAQRQGRQTSSR